MGHSGIPLSADSDHPAPDAAPGRDRRALDDAGGQSPVQVHALVSIPAARRSTARAGVPMLISAILHAGLLLVLGTVVWHTVAPAGSVGGGLIQLSFENPGDGPLAIGSTGAPVVARESAFQPPPSGSLEAILDMSASTQTPISGLSTPPTGDMLPALAGSVSGASGLLSGGFLSASAGAAGGGLAVAGMTDGARAVTFGGLGASSVRSVVYVVDGSGPMVTSLPIVLHELERSISRLSPTQKFGVVIFRRQADGSPPAEAFAPVLMRATPSARLLLRDWLAAVEPSGRSNPLAGLEAALALKPDAIFLLSRSIQRSGGGVWDAGPEATLARLDQLNPVNPVTGRRPVLIQTIQFLDEDPTGTMQAIAAAHSVPAGAGATGYRVVREQGELSGEQAPRSAKAGER